MPDIGPVRVPIVDHGAEARESLAHSWAEGRAMTVERAVACALAD